MKIKLEEKQNRKRLKKERKKAEEEAFKKNTITGWWSQEENERYIAALRLFGKKWALVTKYVKTRTKQQCADHKRVFIK